MNLVAWMIVFCEIAFWIVIGLGLFIRYILKREKLGLFFLALTPVVDLVLLITASWDLYNGAVATLAHSLAAVYIGVSIAFGKSMIQWADEHFKYYILKSGEKPIKRYGMEYAKYYFKSWLRHLLAYMIGVALILAIVFLIDDAERTENLLNTMKLWSLILGIDLLLSITYFIFPKKQGETA